MRRIDAHHHLWHFDPAEFDWLEGPLARLRRDFLIGDFTQAAQLAHVDGAVAVQARQSLAETDWLLQVAATNPSLLGVVGWLPLRSAGFPALLERYREHPSLRGLRHVVQAEPAGFMDDAAFNAGLRGLHGTGLAYDLLIVEAQLPEAIRLVDRHPGQTFVLDHAAKPRIAAAEMEPWAQRIRELARRPHVVCKVSGMVTEANVAAWSPDQLKPYFDVVLEAFSPKRLMAGTDWPVLLAGSSYLQWWEIVAGWIAPLSRGEQAAILAGTAETAYRLPAALPQSPRSKEAV